MLEFAAKRNRSLRNILNQSGPKIEPCGTPENFYSQLLKLLFTGTLCDLLLK